MFPSFVDRPEFLVVLWVCNVILVVLASRILRSILDLGRFPTSLWYLAVTAVSVLPEECWVRFSRR